MSRRSPAQSHRCERAVGRPALFRSAGPRPFLPRHPDLGLFASALAFAVYFHLLRLIGPARAAYSSLLIPVIAMVLSTLFEGYRWTALAAAGAVLALAGLAVALRSRDGEQGVQSLAR